MGLFSRIFGGVETKNVVATGDLSDVSFWKGIGEYGTKEFSTVPAALRAGHLIASGIGMMPLKTKDSNLSKILNVAPCEMLTAVEFREMITMHAVFDGVGRALVIRDKDKKVKELLPIPSSPSEWRLVNGEYLLNVSIPNECIKGDYRRSDIFEITNPRWDYVKGMNVTHSCRKVLALSRQIQDRQWGLSDKKTPFGVITLAAGTSGENVKRLKDQWQKQFGGSQMGIGVLDMDARFTQIVQSAADQQLLETAKFQISEIARMYGVHPYFLMETAGSGAQGAVNDAMLYHQAYTMGPWISRWESAMVKTFGATVEFDENALMRVTPEARAAMYARALGSGGGEAWMTPEDVRAGKPPFGTPGNEEV